MVITHDEDDVTLGHVVPASRVGHGRVDLCRNVSEAATRSSASTTNRVPTKTKILYINVYLNELKPRKNNELLINKLQEADPEFSVRRGTNPIFV